ETSTSHKNRAFERFTDAGPIALLPITKDRYSLVWTLKEADAQTIKQCDETEFLAKLQSAFGFRAGVFTKTGKRDIYPLSLLTTDRPIAHRGLCIGNAAHHLPPVMGQGFNLGMRDLATLAKVISEFPNNIGDFSMLQRYWQQREKDHQTTINMTDSIVRVFSNPSPCFKIARNVGLQLMAHSSTLSQPLVTQAKGQQKGNLNAIF
ncbi:MAG TPA: 2-octaprenyl-6-methoxyphenyl hydroxylase, partial [Psychromonas hadalis]|nr:2-octaprenyl-6-methoxyphenyl hydroxylase [Psychromonas hadalis]